MIAVPRNQVHRDLSKRGFIDTVAGVDYRGNMDQFISEESKSSSAASLPERAMINHDHIPLLSPITSL